MTKKNQTQQEVPVSDEDRKLDFWEKFYHGFTVYHVIGMILMTVGVFMTVHESSIGGESFKLVLHMNFAGVAGFFTFFYELIKSWVKRKNELD